MPVTPACATLPENLAQFRVTESREDEDEDENLTLVRLDPENPVETCASGAATVVAKEVVTVRRARRLRSSFRRTL